MREVPVIREEWRREAAAATDPEEVDALVVKFGMLSGQKHVEATAALAAEARHITTLLVRSAYREVVVRHLLRNPQFTPEHAEQIVRLSRKDLSAGDVDSFAAEDALRWLAKAEFLHADHDVVVELEKAAIEGETLAARVAAGILLAFSDLTEEQLLGVLNRSIRTHGPEGRAPLLLPGGMRDALVHPNATVRVWRAVARRGEPSQAAHMLVDIPAARRDPEIREFLEAWAHNSHEVASKLLKDKGEDLPVAFRTFARQGSILFAARLLNEPDFVDRCRLDPSDLEPLLTAEERHIREGALARLSECEGRAPTPDELAEKQKAEKDWRGRVINTLPF